MTIVSKPANAAYRANYDTAFPPKEPPRREFKTVVDAVLVHVPLDRVELRTRLERIKDDAGFLPPESNYPAWMKLMYVLCSSLSVPPHFDWEKKISDIVEGRAAE